MPYYLGTADKFIYRGPMTVLCRIYAKNTYDAFYKLEVYVKENNIPVVGKLKVHEEILSNNEVETHYAAAIEMIIQKFPNIQKMLTSRGSYQWYMMYRQTVGVKQFGTYFMPSIDRLSYPVYTFSPDYYRAIAAIEAVCRQNTSEKILIAFEEKMKEYRDSFQLVPIRNYPQI